MQKFNIPTFLPIIAIFGSILFLILFGLIGIGRAGADLAKDSSYYFVAAEAWISGINPYDYGAFNTVANQVGIDNLYTYPYPPQSFVLGYLLQLFPDKLIPVVMTALSLCGLLAIVRWCDGQLLKTGETSSSERLLVAAILIGNPLTAHSIWTGNCSMLVIACLIWAWEFSREEQWVYGGILLAIATIKPHLAILVIFWFLLTGKWKLLIFGFFSSIIFSLYPLITLGLDDSFFYWLGSFISYADEQIFVGLEYKVGFPSILGIAGISLPFLPAVGLVAAFSLYLIRRRFAIDSLSTLGLLVAMTVLFVYAHDYDLLILAPFLLALWVSVRLRSAKIPYLIVLIILFIPLRILRFLDPPELLLNWRSVAVILLFIFFAYTQYLRKLTK